MTTGGIKTKFFDNIKHTSLPADSLYLPAKEEIDALMRGELIEGKAMKPSVYARIVVKNALKANPKKNLWVGQGVIPVWFAWAFG